MVIGLSSFQNEQTSKQKEVQPGKNCQCGAHYHILLKQHSMALFLSFLLYSIKEILGTINLQQKQWKILNPSSTGQVTLGWEGGSAGEMWLLTSGAPPNVAPPA